LGEFSSRSKHSTTSRVWTDLLSNSPKRTRTSVFMRAWKHGRRTSFLKSTLLNGCNLHLRITLMGVDSVNESLDSHPLYRQQTLKSKQNTRERWYGRKERDLGSNRFYNIKKSNPLAIFFGCCIAGANIDRYIYTCNLPRALAIWQNCGIAEASNCSNSIILDLLTKAIALITHSRGLVVMMCDRININ